MRSGKADSARQAMPCVALAGKSTSDAPWILALRPAVQPRNGTAAPRLRLRWPVGPMGIASSMGMGHGHGHGYGDAKIETALRTSNHSATPRTPPHPHSPHNFRDTLQHPCQRTFCTHQGCMDTALACNRPMLTPRSHPGPRHGWSGTNTT